jgi:aspartate aminotransferase
VYTKDDIARLADALNAHGKSCGRKPYLICDEPYRDIVYDGNVTAAVFPVYSESVVVSSFAKNLSIPGERIGYVAVNPACEHGAQLSAACTFTNRILGFVNAPAFFQRVVAASWNSSADYSLYKKRRDMLMQALDDAGIEYAIPQGAFYMFCKVPPRTIFSRTESAADDIAFCDHLKQHLVLCAPATSFGYPGWFRMAYCVSEKTIKNSRESLKKAIKAW